MPLLSYFGTMGALLTALLLLANFLLQPQPGGAKPAAAGVETNLPKPGIASRVADRTVGQAPTLVSAVTQSEPRPVVPAPETSGLEQTAGSSMQPPSDRPSSGDMLERAKTEARSRSVRNRDATTRRGRNPTYDSRAYSSYARDMPRLRVSAEGTLGPH